MEEQSPTLLVLLKHLERLQESTLDQPYSITHRLKLAASYRKLGYPDLAAGDAYKALLLVDEVVEDTEFHEEALEAATEDFLATKLTGPTTNHEVEASIASGDNVLTWVQTECLKTAYDVLIGCLLDCGSLRSAFEYTARARKAFPDHHAFRSYDVNLAEKLHAYFKTQGHGLEKVDPEEYPDKGFVRREKYAWNHHEPERTSRETLQFLNDEMAKAAPKLEIRVSELPLLHEHRSIQSDQKITYVKQLGVFAKEDIAPGETVLQEKSLLTGISRLHDSYCDACSAALPSPQANDEMHNIIACEECDEVFFCSPDCHDLAQDLYHPSICGVTIDQGKVPASEVADSLYTMLLLRALALAETQDVHPLELNEVRYIWGDYHTLDLDQCWNSKSADNPREAFCGVPQTLPFTFKKNILIPLQILEKMDVNIFTQSEKYDTWIFNTLYAKFRGTASARQAPDGRPEIGAVHPIWCLANHSCDPNVAWEWQGSIKFWTREEFVDWPGRPPTQTPGIRKDTELLSHYCDIRFPVKERREWAFGALGGDCMCPRCVWEEAEESLGVHNSS